MSWENLFDLVCAVLPVIEARKDKQHEMATAALNSLGIAYHATVAYYESEIPDNVKRREQLDLAEKWDNVANLMRPFDKNLCSRFNLKSRFWREGEAWTPEQIKSANIGLHKIRKSARFHLITKQRSKS